MVSSLQEFLKKQQEQKDQQIVVPQEAEGHSFSDGEPVLPNKIGLKINNSKSSIKPVVKVEDFRNKINEILNQEEEQKKLAYELMSKFQAALKDKTLDSAKTVKIREAETEIVRDVIDFSRIINSDEKQDEDLGTMSLLITLCRSLFIQRDHINEIEFMQTKLVKEIAVLNLKIAKLQENK